MSNTRTGGDYKFLVRASDIAWRSLVIGVAIFGLLIVISKLRFVFLTLFIALLISVVLAPIVSRLVRAGVPRAIAAVLSIVMFITILAGVLWFATAAVTDQFSKLGPTVSKGLNDVEDWLINGPLELSPTEVDDYRNQASDLIRDNLSSAGTGVLAGAIIAIEVAAGAILALILSVFFLKDGPSFQNWCIRHLPARYHSFAKDSMAGSWRALGGFLRGAGTLGIIEAVIIGVTLKFVGADLIVPVMILTFLGAFFPLVGALVAGTVAVLVTLASAGTSEALIVIAVAVVVQNLDNDLLAPVIYGRMVKVHPAIILIAVVTGGTIGGIPGAFIAVPVTSVLVVVCSEAWNRHAETFLAE